jgi:hypothetical protein
MRGCFGWYSLLPGGSGESEFLSTKRDSHSETAAARWSPQQRIEGTLTIGRIAGCEGRGLGKADAEPSQQSNVTRRVWAPRMWIWGAWERERGARFAVLQNCSGADLRVEARNKYTWALRGGRKNCRSTCASLWLSDFQILIRGLGQGMDDLGHGSTEERDE